MALLPFLLLAQLSLATTEEYTVGLLTSSQNTQKSALEKLVPHAVANFNANSTDLKLRLEMATYDGMSLYGLVSVACKLVNNRTVAVISPDGSNTVASAADVFSPLNVPLISLVATDPHIKRANRQNVLLLSPSDKFQSRAILDLLRHFRWHEIAIMASDSNYGINGVHYLQQQITKKDEAKFMIKAITFFNAVADIDSLVINNTLHNIKRSLTRVVILNCEGMYSKAVLSEAYKMGLLEKEYVWIVSDGTTDNPKALIPNAEHYVGLIGIRFSISKDTEQFRSFREEFKKAPGILPDTLEPTPSLVMGYDAIQMAGRALNKLMEKNSIQQPDSSCTYDTWHPWNTGDNYYHALRSTQFQGASGPWSFSEDGMVNKAEYEIVNFRADGYGEPNFHEIGKWSNQGGLQIDPDKQIAFLGGMKERPVGIANSLNGEHLRLGVTENPPFASKIPNCTGSGKSDKCWQGICPDVVLNLSKALNFTYEFVEPADQEFGRLDQETVTWNGLIGDMLAQKTDMITMDLSVGVERKQYIDFTVSFMDSGISLAVKGESGKSDLFFFMSPFGSSVWYMIIVAFVVMGFILNLFSKLSPYGTYGKKVHAMQICKCDDCRQRRLAKEQLNIKFKDRYLSECLVMRTAEEAEDMTMTLYNSLWLTGAGLVGQGAAALPSSPSGRFILFVWWFFILLIVSMYTANLTAFMTLDKIGITIDSAKELLKDNKKKFQWGILDGSFVESLLINNIDPDYKKLVEGAVKVNSVEEGNRRVHEGGFVFLDETPFLSYNLLGSCNIFQVGGEIQPFDYGFGLPKGSPYTELMNTQIIKYRELGFFDELWNKWDKTPADGCGHSHDVGAEEVLQMTTLQGIFFLLLLGLIMSVGLISAETVVATITDEYDERHRTLWSKLARRMRLKYKDLTTEWFMPSKPHKRPDSNGGKYHGLVKLESLEQFASSDLNKHNLTKENSSTNHGI